MKLVIKDKLNHHREPVYEYPFTTWERLAIFMTAVKQTLNPKEYKVEIEYDHE